MEIIVKVYENSVTWEKNIKCSEKLLLIGQREVDELQLAFCFCFFLFVNHSGTYTWYQKSVIILFGTPRGCVFIIKIKFVVFINKHRTPRSFNKKKGKFPKDFRQFIVSNQLDVKKSLKKTLTSFSIESLLQNNDKKR